MSERVSHTVLLCEDELQARLVRSYLRRCGVTAEPPYVREKIASRTVHGGNVGWVLTEFPRELHACRQRNKRARTLLIIVIDADEFEVAQLRRELNEALKREQYPSLNEYDPAVVLIPRRHIETRIRAALGNMVTEEDDCKRPVPKRVEIRSASEQIYDWARNCPAPPPQLVPSLLHALRDWRRIG